MSKIRLNESRLKQIVGESIKKVLNEAMGMGVWNPSPQEREKLRREMEEYEKRHPGVLDEYQRLNDEYNEWLKRYREFKSKYFYKDGWNNEWFLKDGDTYEL